jgi:hypothetical protein
LGDAPQFVEPETLDRQFDDAVAVMVESGRLDIDGDAHLHPALHRAGIQPLDARQAAQHPEVGMRIKKVGCAIERGGGKGVHRKAPIDAGE